MPALEERAQAYVDQGLVHADMAQRVLRCIKQERDDEVLLNEGVGDGAAADASSTNVTSRLSPAQLAALLEDRIAKMKAGRVNDDGTQAMGETDQYRVYKHIVHCIENGVYLRLMVQASAGTGKSFLLTTVYLYCKVRELKVAAAAPTGRILIHHRQSSPHAHRSSIIIHILPALELRRPTLRSSGPTLARRPSITCLSLTPSMSLASTLPRSRTPRSRCCWLCRFCCLTRRAGVINTHGIHALCALHV